jgi:hypothetical protein
MEVASGVLRGKAAIRPYWTWALERQPPLKFELLGVYVGIAKIGIHYRSVGRRLAFEVLTFNDALQVTRGAAHYGELA